MVRAVFLILFSILSFSTWAEQLANLDTSRARDPVTTKINGIDLPEGVVVDFTLLRPSVQEEPPAPPLPLRKPKPSQPAWLKDKAIRSHVKAPIWPAFYKNFMRCADGCKPGTIGTFGERFNPTCHTGGHAIDIHGIVCGKKDHPSLSKRFDQFVGCMKKNMKTIYRSENHYNHAHFSTGCVRDGHRMW